MRVACTGGVGRKRRPKIQASSIICPLSSPQLLARKMERNAVIAIVLQKMLSWVLRRSLSPTIDHDSRYCAFFISMHQYGLYLQSDILSIQPRFGLFTPGPPGLQLRQAIYACVVAFIFCLSFIYAGIGAWEVSYRAQRSPWLKMLRVWAVIQGVGIVAVAGLWVVACHDGVRRPDYPWPSSMVR
ncbi:hypothetical protein F4801DRAFT_276591 [Xylaria longipes]|nr:hypothetical protein F4801DRAFT_276591 [Xylaria longipes]